MKYFSTNEVNSILDLKVKTIQKLIRNKKLLVYRIGNRHYRIAENDLKQYIESQRV